MIKCSYKLHVYLGYNFHICSPLYQDSEDLPTGSFSLGGRNSELYCNFF